MNQTKIRVVNSFNLAAALHMIQGETETEWMKGIEAHDILVVDVRGTDRELEGWIPTSYHFPSPSITPKSMKEFISLDNVKNCKLLVFHCRHTRHRGPHAAHMCLRVLGASPAGPKPIVAVLEGGYFKWVEQFLDNDGMFVNKAPGKLGSLRNRGIAR
eukprot:PhF_6_TR38768/c0_g1_i1/m.58042/K18065/CDC25; Cdc25 family phosphatase